MDPILITLMQTITTIIVVVILLKTLVDSSCGVCDSNDLMEGKTVIVTGANRGIGLETAMELARRKARVILACRNKERGQKAVDNIIATTSNKNVEFRLLDLSSLNSVREFAKDILTTESRLDVLVHNAASASTTKNHLTEDGLELQFATNHFGPFLLNHLLLDLLKKSAPSRIVVVSCLTYLWATMDLDNGFGHQFCERYERFPRVVYNSTKLANLLFTAEFARRLSGTGVTVNVLHPGFVNTNVIWDSNFLLDNFFKGFTKTPEQGAQTTVYLCVASEVRRLNGKFFLDCRKAWRDPRMTNKKLTERLWEISEKATGIS